MSSLLHPLDAIDASVPLPDVRYAGRCPATGRERTLGPTPAVIGAAAALKRYLASRRDASTGFSTRELYAPFTGKMFGVMLCRDYGGALGTLRAFSGGWAGQRQPPGWVGPSAHAGEYAAERARTEAQLAQLTKQIDALKAAGGNGPAIADCKAERRRLSRALTARIHKAYRFENFLGEILPLTEVDTGSPRPPTGMGDCCAPKLLQHAVRHRLEPLGMVEFWWGQSPRTLPRVEGAYYGSCTHKCYPILGFLLRGCDAAAVGP